MNRILSPNSDLTMNWFCYFRNIHSNICSELAEFEMERNFQGRAYQNKYKVICQVVPHESSRTAQW